MVVYSEIHLKHIITRCGQRAEFINVNSSNTYGHNCVLKSYKQIS